MDQKQLEMGRSTGFHLRTNRKRRKKKRKEQCFPHVNRLTSSHIGKGSLRRTELTVTILKCLPTQPNYQHHRFEKHILQQQRTNAPCIMDTLTRAPPHAAATRPSPSPFPGREDCWSEEATFTLIDAWGERHLELNRGNLRQKHWQEVADAVNDRHGHVRKASRTDVQCKNRIDTLKKKYKIEKGRVSESGDYTGAWPFFHRLDSLIGDTFPAKRSSPPANGSDRRNSPLAKSPAWALVPVGRRSVTQKRPPPATSPESMEDSLFRRNFSAFAAAAAAAAEADSENSNGSKWSNGSEKKRKRGRREWEFGYREVAEAIERFGEIYERVEASKQRQMVELEKQRMQFAKDLECQRMQLFMETQVQLQKINRSKRSSKADSLS